MSVDGSIYRTIYPEFYIVSLCDESSEIGEKRKDHRENGEEEIFFTIDRSIGQSIR